MQRTRAICYVYQNIYARKLISYDWYGLGGYTILCSVQWIKVRRISFET